MTEQRRLDAVRLLACPVCSQPLSESMRSLRCGSGHSFDFARAGSIDLLPSGHGRTGKTGDTREMIAARRRFLARGWYSPLQNRIVELATAVRPRTVVEAGSGEGSWIGAVADAVPSAACIGVDVSRDAIQSAARAYPRVLFVRNDVHGRLSLQPGCVDLLLDIFAPRNRAEFARVVRRDGTLIVVVPTPGHLASLREVFDLLGIEAGKARQVARALEPEFEVESTRQVGHALDLDADGVADLLRMTPNYFHLGDADIAAAGIRGISTEAAFEICVFRRTATE